MFIVSLHKGGRPQEARGFTVERKNDFSMMLGGSEKKEKKKRESICLKEWLHEENSYSGGGGAAKEEVFRCFAKSSVSLLHGTMGGKRLVNVCG